MCPTKPKVLVAMSGGVDSSVAAALLQREGYVIVGCFMRLGSPGEAIDECSTDKTIRIGHQGCCSLNDADDARLVAAKLDIPFYVCNFKQDFGRIIDYFVDEYNIGRTPNPCIRCNDWLKFGKLHEYAKQINADFIATGHYARIDHTHPDNPRLLRGIDSYKDQSYVLFGTPRNQLKDMLLPIGEYHKSEIRALAREFDLSVSDKPDSQEICFVPDNEYANLITQRTPEKVQPGDVLDTDGKVIGQHPGHQHFTIGQRRGLGIALGHPVYVTDRDPIRNTITIGERDDLLSTGCTADQTNWLTDMKPEPSNQWTLCFAQIRYNAKAVPAKYRFCTVTLLQGANVSHNQAQKPTLPQPLPQREGGLNRPPSEGGLQGGGASKSELSINTGHKSDDEQILEVHFDKPQPAVAPGQAVVCYSEDEPEVMLGGGWIRHAFPAQKPT